jgi:hypothetical protein
MRWVHGLSIFVFTGCAQLMHQGDQPSTPAPTPVPTAQDPLNGLPALSTSLGTPTLALPTLGTTDDKQQVRTIAFVALGDTEGTQNTLDVPATPADTFVTQLHDRYRDGKYESLPWVMTPDDPPLPLALDVKGTQITVEGDAKAQLSVAIAQAGKPLGSDVYRVEGESATSSEHVVAIGATVVWRDNNGFAYVRYDVNDGTGRDSDWRVVTFAKAAEPAK